MALTEFVNLLQDFAEIAVTVLLVYAVYKIAMLIDTLSNRIRGEKTPN